MMYEGMFNGSGNVAHTSRHEVRCFNIDDVDFVREGSKEG